MIQWFNTHKYKSSFSERGGKIIVRFTRYRDTYITSHNQTVNNFSFSIDYCFQHHPSSGCDK